MSRLSKDPYWLTARFSSTCPQCHGAIKKGDRIFYYPIGRKALCAGPECGAKASAEFEGSRMDEAFMTGETW